MVQPVLLEACFSINTFTWTVNSDGVLFLTREETYYQNPIKSRALGPFSQLLENSTLSENA
jgi:hypothetical protein